MCTSDDPDFCADGHVKPVDTTPLPNAEATPHPNVGRRTFLKAAALGTAAAAFLNKGVSLGPLSAYAHDLSGSQCTANDVRIVGGLGQVVNEPCDCNGTFTAEVQFTVENNAASDRGCITLHLAGGPFAVGDIILNGGNPIPGKTTQVMTGFIENFPCGAGLVCFGLPGEEIRGRCSAPCSTVSWTVPGQDTCPPDRVISSKCRHQQICIQGRGATTLDCDVSTTSVDSNCTVPCGGTATLRLCTSSPAGFGPFTFTLSDGQTSGAISDTCYDFTVGPLNGDASYTGTVTDSTGCARSATVNLTVNEIDVPVALAGEPDCDGNVDYSVETCIDGITYTWQEVDCGTGDPIGDPLGTGCSISKQWPADSTHCVVVTASNGTASCDQTSEAVSVTVPAAVAISLDAFVQADCTGAGSFTAHASGGVGPYTFEWFIDDVVVDGVTGDVLTIEPLLDGACHKYQVRASDSRGCQSPNRSTQLISQCVETTSCELP